MGIENERVAEFAEGARKVIYDTYRLELTTIERARLKEYVRPVLEELSKARNKRDKFDPRLEISTRFMIDYYGLPLDYARVSFCGPAAICDGFYEFLEYDLDKNPLLRYVHHLQERFHMP
jgi:hypothetical protein